MKYVVKDGEKRVSVWKDMIAGAHMFNEKEVRAVLLEIGNSIGFGRAQQILGEEWEREHNCAPRGRMGVTIKDESFAHTLGEPVAVPDAMKFRYGEGTDLGSHSCNADIVTGWNACREAMLSTSYRSTGNDNV